jgi:hypothetical protein
MHHETLVETGDRVAAFRGSLRRRTVMPEKNPRGETTEGLPPTPGGGTHRESSAPDDEAHTAVPVAPDSKRERQMTDFPDGA